MLSSRDQHLTKNVYGSVKGYPDFCHDRLQRFLIFNWQGKPKYSKETRISSALSARYSKWPGIESGPQQ
jgi:hypothetical protein